ncbi:MAG: thiamine pyrophosphate-dependent enzyme [Armatimonadetes bacterium]|nr:thiamine pyrophosphate-dependent enzyme [Armatimonadota bacterium]MDW8122751.1 thiamine pyrophosphate-dependent enzyme [Armatimonadota bacterium]
MPSVKDLAEKTIAVTGGHRACAGCPEPMIARWILMSSDRPVIAALATGCLEVCSTIFPYTAWNVPYIHVAFENVAAVASGIVTACKALKKRGEYDKEVNIVAFAGDGGTYDIGLQALSGALERGHRFVFVCMDNQAYMNTGIQRSGATPHYAATTTSPAGAQAKGKPQKRKDIMGIVAAHGIPYAAQAAPSHWKDLLTKAEKAFKVDGPAFLNVLIPCNLGWGFEPEETLELSRLAVETCFWPLYEVENGKVKINYKPRHKVPVVEFLKRQRRYRHLFEGDHKELLEEIQSEVDQNWQQLLSREALSAA